MKVDPQDLLEKGYVIIPPAIAPERLEGLRASFEKLVDRQRSIWAQERQPDDPPGGAWETSAQPRLRINHMGDEQDEQTASTLELWLHESRVVPPSKA